jgi:3-dehydroquinate dehydratase/shikimate dehydrogenase
LNDSPFEPTWFRRGTYVFDVVYNPEQTLFIKLARQAGCETITGVDMFVRQAAKQFELFTGIHPEEKLIREEITRAISAARY